MQLSDLPREEKRKPEIKTFLFDMDGTLVDSLSVHTRSLASLLYDRLGLTSDLDELSRRIQGVPSRRILAWFTDDRVDELFQAWAEYEVPLQNDLRLFSGMRTVLETLHARGEKLGVVTSQTREELTAIRRLLDIDALIDTWVCIDDVVHPKPHPEPVLMALKQLRETTEQALMIGDTLFDLRAGRQAGVWVGAALWGMSKSFDLDGFQPDFLLEQPADLLRFCRADDRR